MATRSLQASGKRRKTPRTRARKRYLLGLVIKILLLSSAVLMLFFKIITWSEAQFLFRML